MPRVNTSVVAPWPPHEATRDIVRTAMGLSPEAMVIHSRRARGTQIVVYDDTDAAGPGRSRESEIDILMSSDSDGSVSLIEYLSKRHLLTESQRQVLGRASDDSWLAMTGVPTDILQALQRDDTLVVRVQEPVDDHVAESGLLRTGASKAVSVGASMFQDKKTTRMRFVRYVSTCPYVTVTEDGRHVQAAPSTAEVEMRVMNGAWQSIKYGMSRVAHKMMYPIAHDPAFYDAENGDMRHDDRVCDVGRIFVDMAWRMMGFGSSNDDDEEDEEDVEEEEDDDSEDENEDEKEESGWTKETHNVAPDGPADALGGPSEMSTNAEGKEDL